MTAAWENIENAMILVDNDRPKRKRRTILMAALALVSGIIAGQVVVLDDGRSIIVEMARPTRGYFVALREGDDVTLKSVHKTPEEATSRLEELERDVKRETQGGQLQ